MVGCLDCADCFYCGRLLSPRHEHDHFPWPRRAGGTQVVPVCIDCHDVKDRFNLINWPITVLAAALAGQQTPDGIELVLSVAQAIPEAYRARLDLQGLGDQARSLEEWSDADMVAAVLSATTTEARLYLAKALALCLDAGQRPRQDSNLRPAD